MKLYCPGCRELNASYTDTVVSHECRKGRDVTTKELTISEERVAQGIALLDEYNADWWRLVELKTLNLVSPWDCILGQVFGTEENYFSSGYEIGLRKLGLVGAGGALFTRSGEHAVRFGFVMKEDEKVWRRVISARQAKARKAEVQRELVAA